MKHLFIINALAARERKKRKAHDALIAAIGRLEGDVEIRYTQPPEQGAQQLARAAAETGAPVRIYACGGDGTLNEVVNGAAGFDNAAVTNVPLGTANDFLKIFGPHYRQGFRDLDALAAGPQTPLDVMNCNGRLGLGIICAGVDARVAAGVDRYKAVPLVKGKGAYILSLMENVLLKSIARPTHVELGDRSLDLDMTVLCVCNGRYYGGGFMPVGEAMPDDGVLDMLVVPKVSRLTFARLVGDYSKGKYADHPDLIHAYHGQTVRFSSPEEITVVVDGEVIKGFDFTVTLDQRKVNFFYPQSLHYRQESVQPAAAAL